MIPKDNNLNKMIKNLHEKRKILIDGEEDGLERYRRLKLNQKLNNFNKNLITGHWSHIKSSFDGNDHSNYLNEYKKNNSGIKVYYSPIEMNKNKSDNNIIIKNNENNNKKDTKSNINLEKTKPGSVYKNVNNNKTNERKKKGNFTLTNGQIEEIEKQIDNIKNKLENKIKKPIKKIFKNLKSRTVPIGKIDISEIKEMDNTTSEGGSTTAILTDIEGLNTNNSVIINKPPEKEKKPIPKEEKIKQN